MANFDRAKTASDAIVEEILFAQPKLSDVTVNGYGIVADPSELRSRLMAAGSALDMAIATLNTTEWPTALEYAAAENED